MIRINDTATDSLPVQQLLANLDHSFDRSRKKRRRTTSSDHITITPQRNRQQSTSNNPQLDDKQQGGQLPPGNKHTVTLPSIPSTYPTLTERNPSFYFLRTRTHAARRLSSSSCSCQLDRKKHTARIGFRLSLDQTKGVFLVLEA